MNSLKTTTARASRPRTGVPNPINNDRSAMWLPHRSVTPGPSQIGRDARNPAVAGRATVPVSASLESENGRCERRSSPKQALAMGRLPPGG
jgi:hypothetical protein